MRTNIYIRLENEDAWHALENKSEWVNERLSGTITDKKLNDIFDRMGPAAVPSPIITPRNQDMQFCKHSAVIGFCKKGCK